jgi:hypothetical protein
MLYHSYSCNAQHPCRTHRTILNSVQDSQPAAKREQVIFPHPGPSVQRARASAVEAPRCVFLPAKTLARRMPMSFSTQRLSQRKSAVAALQLHSSLSPSLASSHDCVWSLQGLSDPFTTVLRCVSDSLDVSQICDDSRLQRIATVSTCCTISVYANGTCRPCRQTRHIE